jgi:hypothetical protein
MNNASLILNCFPVELSPVTLDLPFFDHETWEASTKELNERYARYTAHRFELNQNQIRTVLFDGPELPQNLDLLTTDVADFPNLGKKIIKKSISSYFEMKGLKTLHSNFRTLILKKSPDFSQGMVNLFCGIAFQVQRPFQDNPYGFIVCVKWEVSVFFEKSLEEPILRNMSVGMPVIYKPNTETGRIPEDLRCFRNKYLGKVREIVLQSEAVVFCKDKALRQIPLSDLFIEASPASIREYEKRLGMRHASRSLWYKIQECNFVLTPQGRRNPTVLKDRLQAIRKFLGADSRDILVMPLSCFQKGVVSINLSPMRVEVK